MKEKLQPCDEFSKTTHQDWHKHFRSVDLKKISSESSHGTMTGFNRVWSTSAERTLTSINYSSKHNCDSPLGFQTTLNCNKETIWLTQHNVECIEDNKRFTFLKSIFKRSLLIAQPLWSFMLHHHNPISAYSVEEETWQKWRWVIGKLLSTRGLCIQRGLISPVWRVSQGK